MPDSSIPPGVAAAAMTLRGCVFVGDDLGVWMTQVADEGHIAEWCLSVAAAVIEAAKEAS